jgi:hypothetical protein
MIFVHAPNSIGVDSAGELGNSNWETCCSTWLVRLSSAMASQHSAHNFLLWRYTPGSSSLILILKEPYKEFAMFWDP